MYDSFFNISQCVLQKKVIVKNNIANINSKIEGNNSRKSHARVMNLSHNMCVMIRNTCIYLKFEVDTLKSKEVIIFLKENPKFKER
jgi:hypothetical protein